MKDLRLDLQLLYHSYFKNAPNVPTEGVKFGMVKVSGNHPFAEAVESGHFGREFCDTKIVLNSHQDHKYMIDFEQFSVKDFMKINKKFSICLTVLFYKISLNEY